MWKTFNLLYQKFIQDNVYQILSGLTGFRGRYDKIHFGVFFGSQCSFHDKTQADTFVVVKRVTLSTSRNITF